MQYTRNFNQLSKDDAHIAGGKGASLGEMLQNNIPVPDGYVVTADTFDHFIKETDLIQEIEAVLDTVNTKTIHTVENASEEIQALIKHAEIPKDIADEVLEQYKSHDMEYVAVRSSATAEDGADHAWAGQLDSYLNTTKENLLEMVQLCWASLFTPRAIFYRFEKGLHTTHISVAVVIQKMVNSEKSGIAFSVHPVTEDYNQIIIEAGFGLGEAIVSGSVTPDSYVVTKEPQDIIDTNVNTQNKALYRGTTKTEHGFNEWKDLPKDQAETQVLNKDQIKELSNIIVTIERHYGFPCDIEWAFEGDTFYIVQSRPITTLKPILKELTYKEILHLPMSLALVELHYEQESTKDIPWAEDEFIYSPYIAYDKQDDQVYLYYNPEGIEWQKEQAGKYQKEEFAIENIKKNYGKVKEILEEEKELNRKELLSFIATVREFWPWLNYMWWAIEYREAHNQNFDQLMEMRKYTEYFFPGIMAVLRKSLSTIYSDISEYVDFILLSEVENNSIPSNKVLQSRKDSYAYTNNSLYSSWEELQKDFSIKIQQEPKHVGNELKGQIAFKGVVQGKVRIISKREEIKYFKDGEILVASTTTPDYLPAMKLSGAIVSEHGGMICHAAITSRELKVPCIVGVHGATKILKTGSLVEVDADNGVVKVIKE